MIRKEIIAAFKIQEAREYFFDHINLALLVLNQEGIILEINEYFLKNLGYKRSEMVGQPYWLFLHKDDLLKSRELEKANVLKKTFLKGESVYTDRYKRKDGSYATLRWKENGAIFYQDYYMAYAEIE